MLFVFLYFIFVAKIQKGLYISRQNKLEVKMVMKFKEPQNHASSPDEDDNFAETSIDELCEDLESLSFD